MQILQSDLETVRNLNEQGLYLQSYNYAVAITSLDNWEGTDALLSASSFAHNLGAVDASRRFAHKAWKNDRQNARVLFSKAGEILSRRGAVPCLLFLRKNSEVFKGDEQITAWWFSLHADVFAFLRDFSEADRWHKKAAEISPEEPWVWVVGSRLHEAQDRYQEALEMGKKAFDLQKWDRGSVQWYCHLLTLLEKDETALEVLTEAASKLENVWIYSQLGDLQSELEQHQASYQTYKKILDITPIKEEGLDDLIYSRLSDVAYLCGNLEESIEYIEKCKSPFHQKIKQNLAEREKSAKRKLLKSGFVRQHQLTCAPATLSNIGRFWEKPVEHLEVAEQISYDGTPAYKERLWAEKNGWVTREFTLNWEDTEKLIDGDIPFTLATVQPGNGHLQAVVGYDTNRKTLLIRDPYFRNIRECELEGLLKDQESSGPRCLALVPAEKASILSGLTFKESAQYDLLFKVETALEEFDRERAILALSEMENSFAEHRLTLFARWALARYDANNLDLLETVERLREKFPDDINFKLSFLSASNEHQTREDRLKILEEFTNEKNTDPLIWQMFGYELGLDAREHARALRKLYKTARKLPSDGGTYRLIADIYWRQRRFEEASELYRFASCLNDKDEHFAYSYFQAQRHLKKTKEALSFLKDRFDRFGTQSNLPGQSLFHALLEVGDGAEAFNVLQSALEKRPDDGEMRLFAAEANARFGKIEDAQIHLRASKDKSSSGNWLRKAALIEQLKGNLNECLLSWKQIVANEPLAQVAHESIAEMLSFTEGTESAQKYLQKVHKTVAF